MERKRFSQLFATGKKILSVFITAGYPSLRDTPGLCRALEDAGVDLIEIGFPFSDSLVDGPTIQASSEVALRNGMTLDLYFEEVMRAAAITTVPLIAMTAFNPVLQFGVKRFVRRAKEVGFSGAIIPDLPVQQYEKSYRSIFEQHGFSSIFLITPHTTEERIRSIDSLSSGFIYAVSSDAVTGGHLAVNDEYLQRISAMNLRNPILVGFGIHDRKSFDDATRHAHGGIIGSAFIRAIGGGGHYTENVLRFVNSIRAAS